MELFCQQFLNFQWLADNSTCHGPPWISSLSSFGWTLPLRWTSWGCQSAASISEPCLSPEWERPQRASSSWTMCPPPFSTISLSTPSTTGLLSLRQSWTHTSRYEDCVWACLVLPVSHCLFAPLILEVSSYLLAEAFLSKCLSVLEDELNPDNCWSYLSLAQEICCEQLKRTVFTYMSRNLLEMPHLLMYASLWYINIAGLKPSL